MGSILQPRKIAKIADFFINLCDAITDVIFSTCIDAIFLKKNVRFDAISIAIAIPVYNTICCNFDTVGAFSFAHLRMYIT